MPNTSDTRRELLPIKVVLPDQGKERMIQPGGPEAKPFVPVDRAYRTRLQKEISAVRQLVTTQVQDVGSAAMRVKLRTKAVAKSHRPIGLFSDISCPIIGAGKLGELFVKATPRGLTRLARNIEINEAKSIVKEISTIEVIEPITPVFRRKRLSPIEILKKSPRRNDGFVLQVRLFDFGQEDQRKHIEHFQSICEKRNLTVDQKGYDNASQVFAVRCKDVADVEAFTHTKCSFSETYAVDKYPSSANVEFLSAAV